MPSREDIFAAADRLAAEGKRPTLEAVRQITGGSYSTISPILKEWRAQKEKLETPLEVPMPPEVEAVVKSLWAAALKAADARIAAEREALAKARAEMEAERDEAVQIADRMCTELEAVKAAAAKREADLIAEIEALKAEVSRAREETARLQGQIETLRQMEAVMKDLLAERKKRHKPSGKPEEPDQAAPAEKDDRQLGLIV